MLWSVNCWAHTLFRCASFGCIWNSIETLKAIQEVAKIVDCRLLWDWALDQHIATLFFEAHYYGKWEPWNTTQSGIKEATRSWMSKQSIWVHCFIYSYSVLLCTLVPIKGPVRQTWPVQWPGLCSSLDIGGWYRKGLVSYTNKSPIIWGLLHAALWLCP